MEPEFPTPSEAGSDILSQSEVENLLAEVARQQAAVVVHKGSDETEKRVHKNVQAFDFHHPVSLSPSEMRRLRLRHEEFARALAARLSTYLRIEFSLQLSKLQTQTFQKFTESLPAPSHLTLFKVEPLRGVAILDIHPRLGMTVVDRLMGGPAHSVSAEHEPSEIELALLDQIVDIVLSEWSNHLSSRQELRPIVIGHESQGRFLQTSPANAVMLVIVIEARLGDCLEKFHIGLPHYMMEPLLEELRQSPEAAEGQTAAAAPARWKPCFDDVPVPVTASWNGLELSARELGNLKPGDTLELSPETVQRLCLALNGVGKFWGQLGTVGEKWAVQLTQRIKE
jgi:flagellar motor switch protein FliM